MKRLTQILVSLYAGSFAYFESIDMAPGNAPVSAAPPAEMSRSAAPLPADEATKIATDAYVFAYPLVTMRVTEQVMTNTDKAGDTKAPVGQFANHQQYPDPSNHSVTAPNADTLYSVAWLDLSKGPMVFSHPEMGKRFYMFPLLDAYTNVLRTPGARDDGGAAATYVITGPGWKESKTGDKIPNGAKEIKSPTNMVWILGRTYSSGTSADYKAVHELQAKYDLRPLGAGASYQPPAGAVDPKVDEKTAVRNQVDAMKGDEFFAMAAELMASNPPSQADAPMVEKMAKIGVVPGQPFQMSHVPPEAAAAVMAAPKTGQARIRAQLKNGGATVSNGWLVTTKTGTYGTDYDQRAFVTAIGLGANRPEQAIYPFADTDGMGQKLDGRNRYVIHFASDGLPPAKGFWSITMYTPEMFFFPNPLKRYTVSSRTKFHKNADGSVDVVVQNQKPATADQEANWLPAPAGGFALMMRLYWPEQKNPSILDGTWKPPGVTPATETQRAGRTPPRR